MPALPRSVLPILLLLAFFTGCTSPEALAPRAFPSAEGFGAHTIGGRGGKILEVTTLADAGPGSLRAAIETPGPRTIIFRTGGIILLKSPLAIRDPFITIAGQTAPGDGICIRGAQLRVRTHDVILRGLRLRTGDELFYDHSDEPDGLSLLAGPWPKDDPKHPYGDGLDVPVYNVLIDHCSISWSVDENIGMWSNAYKDPKGNHVRNVTIQWCIISEGLYKSVHHKGPHSMGILVGHRSTNISFHHNLLAHNNARNPVLQGGTETEWINNVVYNWDDQGMVFGDWADIGWIRVNIIGNVYKAGPTTENSPPRKRAAYALLDRMYGPDRAIKISRVYPDSRFYLAGNITPRVIQPQAYQPAAIEVGFYARPIEPLISPTPAVKPSGIVTHPAADAYALVLAHAGATAPRRDTIDTRVVEQVRTTTGRIIDSPRDVGGFPPYDPGTPPVDSDHDGMPNTWELAHALNPNNPTDAQTPTPSGPTHLEHYLNSLLPPPTPPTTSRPASR